MSSYNTAITTHILAILHDHGHDWASIRLRGKRQPEPESAQAAIRQARLTTRATETLESLAGRLGVSAWDICRAVKNK